MLKHGLCAVAHGVCTCVPLRLGAGAHPNIDLLLKVRDGALPEMDIIVDE